MSVRLRAILGLGTAACALVLAPTAGAGQDLADLEPIRVGQAVHPRQLGDRHRTAAGDAPERVTRLHDVAGPALRRRRGSLRRAAEDGERQRRDAAPAEARFLQSPHFASSTRR